MDVTSNPEDELNQLVLWKPDPYDLIPCVSYFAQIIRLSGKPGN